MATAAKVTSLLSTAEQDHAAPDPRLPADPELFARLGFLTSGSSEPTGLQPREPGQLRWSIRTPSPAGPRGDLWGDTYFADAVAAALRGMGHDVVTRRREANDAGPTHLDDIALAVRGLVPFAPVPGCTNALWVISHPDEVEPAELEGYDLVFAASHRWSATVSERTGREVVPLLQASAIVPPPEDDQPLSPGELSLVFVGSAKAGRERPLVRLAAEAGVPLAVYGPGWQDLPPGVWKGSYVDNGRLAHLYRHHGLVLADHWPDMARNGFIANRVFDALAAGARVVCDDVAGIHDVFDPRDVAVVRTADEISAAVETLRAAFQDPEPPRPSLSFDDRARTLVTRLAGG